MKYNREFEIAWLGLKPGLQSFTYDIDHRFMQERGADETYTNWEAQVILGFDKHENFFMLKFDIDGAVTLPCDRCGDDFALRLWDEFNIIVKLTADEAVAEEAEDDIIFLSRNETVIDVSKWIYEFLMLSIPLQHIHPDKSDGSAGCNPQALNLLDKLTENNANSVKPIWQGLASLKDKKFKS
jgi:uncharacterized metal-binding protein YceD (DUF177 family)